MAKYTIEFDDELKDVNIYLVKKCPTGFQETVDLKPIPYTQPDDDAKDIEMTCEFCRYIDVEETGEPCKSCSQSYINMFKPKVKPYDVCFGDELRSTVNPNTRVCILQAKDDGWWSGILITKDGFGLKYSDRCLTGWKKTGRNFSSVLEEILNEQY